jgi:hypothetical protein
MDKETSSDEIEITPEMVEAGYRAFVRSGVTDDPLEADKLTVEEIYGNYNLNKASFGV